MELAATAFAALATSGTAAAATTAGSWLAGTTITTAAGVTSSLAATSGVLGTLSTVATVASGVSSIVGGYMAYRQAQGQADVAELNAGQARLDAEEKGLRIRRELVQKVGAARVAFAGSGLDISSAAAIEQGYRAEADFETSLARTSGTMAAAGQRMAAAGYRARGVSAMIEGLGRAGGGYIQNEISIARRG